MKILKLTICDLKRVVLSWQLYFAIGLVFLTSFITLKNNTEQFNLFYFENLGTINLFLYSNVISNGIMSILAPFIAIVVFSTATLDDMKTGYIKNCTLLGQPKKYLKARVISTALTGGGVFAISYSLLFAIYLIIDPSASVRTSFRFGLFLDVYDRSLLLYCAVFILHSFIFGMVYSLFGMGISMVIKNKYIALGLPFVLYYAAPYLMWAVPEKISKLLSYFIPFLTFEISTIDVPLYKNATQLLFILCISVIMISVGYRRWRKGHWY